VKLTAALALLLLGASPEPKTTTTTLLEQIQKLLPRGWTVETRGVPPGVAGLALGPVTRTGRAVVMVSILEGGTQDEELSDAEARRYLADTVESSGAVGEVSPVADGVPGAAEFAAVAPMSGSEERLVRYLVASGNPSYLLTVVAPKSSFESTYRQVVEIATRLRRSTMKQ
jgi:hypothetical protein